MSDMSDLENPQPNYDEPTIPLKALIEYLNELGGDNEVTRAKIAELIGESETDGEAVRPDVAKIERGLGALGARQAVHKDLTGLLIALSLDGAGKLRDVRGFEDP